MDVNTKAMEFTKQINLALDECAPFKNYKVKDNFKLGLSYVAKQLILERDSTRKKKSEAPDLEKPALKAKYKQLCNKTISQIS